MDLVAAFLDDDMNAHRLAGFHAIVIDETLGLIAPSLPFGDGRAHALFGEFEQARETRDSIVAAEFADQFDDALFAQARRAELSTNVAEHEFGRAAVSGDD